MTDRLLLKDVCTEYFGLTESAAQRRARQGLLPVPAFRITGTKKGPFYVQEADLQEHIANQIIKAKKLHSQMKQAGRV